MKSSELSAALHAEPFLPFRARLTGGRFVEVRFPELVVISQTKRTAIAYRPNSDDWDVLSLGQIERLEFLEDDVVAAPKREARRRPKSRHGT